MNSLDAISPVDGRYRRTAEPLAAFFSERSLMRYRIVVEGEYLIYLSEYPHIGVRPFSDEEKGLVRKLADITLEDASIIKAIETKGYEGISRTNHDVKAVEYYMKLKLKGTTLDDVLEWIHFALTSEDCNNLAYAQMMSDAIGKVILPTLDKVDNAIGSLAHKYEQVPMLARTHGQPASPTTIGKEFKVYHSRLERQLMQLADYEILVKLNGATGNWSAHSIAYPNLSFMQWYDFSKDFIKKFDEGRRLKLKHNRVTTQIEPHDTYAELFGIMSRINTILIDFNQDIWRYISDEWVVQKPQEDETGSSTMPHKVNPIDFENSEGNLGMANALFEFFSKKLPVSRLQRDLSDSSVLRNIGVSFAHSLIAYQSLLNGLERINVNEAKVVQELEEHPEVISEAYQTILRREGADMPYERLKYLTRGKKVTMQDLWQFVESLDVSEAVKAELKRLTPTNYTGIAALIVGSN